MNAKLQQISGNQARLKKIGWTMIYVRYIPVWALHQGKGVLWTQITGNLRLQEGKTWVHLRTYARTYVVERECGIAQITGNLRMHG